MTSLDVQFTQRFGTSYAIGRVLKSIKRPLVWLAVTMCRIKFTSCWVLILDVERLIIVDPGYCSLECRLKTVILACMCLDSLEKRVKRIVVNHLT